MAVTEPLMVEPVTDSAAPAATVHLAGLGRVDQAVRPLLTVSRREWVPVMVVVQVGW